MRRDLEDLKIDEAISICNKQIDQSGAIPANMHMRTSPYLDSVGAMCYLKKGAYEKALEDVEAGLHAKELTEKDRVTVLLRPYLH